MSLDEISQMSASSSATTMTSLNRAAQDYEDRTIDYMRPLLENQFKKMWQETMNKIKASHLISRRLAVYQQLLTTVPNWNTVRLEEMADMLQKDDVETLVQGLVMIKTKMQSILSSPDTKILMKVPTIQYVIHKCSIEVARLLYKNVDVMDSMVPRQKYMENQRVFGQIVERGIQKGIASFVPTVALLRKQSKQIEDRLRQELCIDEHKDVDEQSMTNVQIKSLATPDIADSSMPMIREAPPVMPVAMPDPIPEATPDVVEPMQSKGDLPVVQEEMQMQNELVGEEKIPSLVGDNVEAMEEPVHHMQPKHVISMPTQDVKMDQQEAPIMVNDINDKSFSLSLLMDVKEEIPATNNDEQFE